uniref:Putative neuropeptide-like 1 isoform x3 n=1 Tax=Phlebotomus kandelakii TaxID=1109342 RepID=A0A6B2ECD8_9DIPT
MGKNKLFFSTRLLFPTAATLCLLIQSVHPQAPQTGVINPCVLDQILNLISTPDEGYDIHRIALRNRLRSILERAIDESDYQRLDDNENGGDFLADKRSINSLARAGLFPKRNLGSVLRTGGFQRTGGDNGGGGKRSLAALAKTGQLPSKEPDAELAPSSHWLDMKRNLGALARSGNLYLSGKRNLAALSRGNMLPQTKREWIEEERRSIGALARDWALPNQKNKDEEEEELKEKKNIGALKNSPIHGIRQKRQASYTDFADGAFEVPEPVVQTSPIDYEDILESLNSLNSNAHFEDKRYLGSMARNGWLRSFGPKEKRHIGSLARFGLLRSDLESGIRQMPLRRPQEKRHIGALARTDFPSNPTDFSNLSPARVDDALLSFSHAPVGQHLDSTIGAHHLDSPPIGAEASESRTIELPQTGSADLDVAEAPIWSDSDMDTNDIIDYYPLPTLDCINCFPPLLF